MENIIEILKRLGQKIFTISQKILLTGSLFFIYFFIFGWFSLLAKIWEKRQLKRARLMPKSHWLKPALESSHSENIYKQS